MKRPALTATAAALRLAICGSASIVGVPLYVLGVLLAGAGAVAVLTGGTIARKASRLDDRLQAWLAPPAPPAAPLNVTPIGRSPSWGERVCRCDWCQYRRETEQQPEPPRPAA